MKPVQSTARYQTIGDGDKRRYCFFCDITGAQVCTQNAYPSDDVHNGAMLAWEREGRNHFNLCHRCGRWVVDAAYNPQVLECIQCATFEYQARFCKFCGTRVSETDRVCPNCKNPLYYEGVDAYDTKGKT